MLFIFLGLTISAVSFLILYFPQFYANNEHLISPFWLVIAYFLQAISELCISALGLAMVAELCPEELSGFVMGAWFLTVMIAGPLGAWIGNLTQPPGFTHFNSHDSLSVYCNAFGEIGLITAIIAILMWAMRPVLIYYTNPQQAIEKAKRFLFESNAA